MSAPCALSFDVVGLFPEIVDRACRSGVIGRALEKGVLDLRTHQLRNYTGGSPHPVDDEPYGGGPGLVMRPEPIYAAVEDVCSAKQPGERAAWKILVTPQGTPFSQGLAKRLAIDGPTYSTVLIFCGRYEGVDERVRSLFDEEISLGDFVLTGGEIAAAAIIDAVARLIPGVLGCADSPHSESFGLDGLLEYPQYTRPADFRGQKVPPVLQSGDHAAIRRWRQTQALERTRERRPDLFNKVREK
jgi:tRNA (guanine37-N1)-methyltransferase